MMKKTVTSLAFAAGCVLAFGAMPRAHAQDANPQVVTNGPQPSPGDLGNWSARRNVIESMQYDGLLQRSRAFREARIRKECGPIGDPQLHHQCLASFDQHELALVGSSIPPAPSQRAGGY
jgi:hypothetical protein